MLGDLQRTVGRNLRRVRKGRGVSQEVLASQVEMHRTYIGAVERGERNLTLQTVERLAEQLDVNPIQLILDIDLLDGLSGLDPADPGPADPGPASRTTLAAADGGPEIDASTVRPRTRSIRPRLEDR